MARRYGRKGDIGRRNTLAIPLPQFFRAYSLLRAAFDREVDELNDLEKEGVIQRELYRILHISLPIVILAHTVIPAKAGIQSAPANSSLAVAEPSGFPLSRE